VGENVMTDPRPPESEVTIGRLKKRISKLQEQRDSYKKQLEHYKIVVGGDWNIERRYNKYQDMKNELQRVRDLETRVKEQEELIKLLRKEQ
jgi:exonuclease III